MCLGDHNTTDNASLQCTRAYRGLVWSYIEIVRNEAEFCFISCCSARLVVKPQKRTTEHAPAEPRRFILFTQRIVHRLAVDGKSKAQLVSVRLEVLGIDRDAERSLDARPEVLRLPCIYKLSMVHARESIPRKTLTICRMYAITQHTWV